MGVLGIKDLSKFIHSSRLRWLWHHWDTKGKSWKYLLKVTDPKDRHLFFCSTTIEIKDGRYTPFWEARWLQGKASKELAPHLYKIAKFQRSVVQTELQNHNWI
jgi:hypothetical protein